MKTLPFADFILLPLLSRVLIVAESKGMEVDDDDIQKGGLVISDVSEFVSNLSSSAVQIPSARPAQSARARERSAEATGVSTPAAQEETKGEEEQEEVDNARSRTRAESEVAEDEDVPMKESNTEAQSSVVSL